MIFSDVFVRKFKDFMYAQRTQLAAVVIMLIILIFFTAMYPEIFLNYDTYRALFTIYTMVLILACGLVFIITSGETDLSFPSTVGLSLWVFSEIVTVTGYPFLALAGAIGSGLLVGFINGILVTKVRLRSLGVTLGMNFLLRGLVNVGAGGEEISLIFLEGTAFSNMFVGHIMELPVQVLWGFGFFLICLLLFNKHRFGVHIRYVGDNRESAREAGVKVDRARITAFMLLGFASAIVGVLSGLVSTFFWPYAGDGYLQTTMAAVFIGGTPTWGGVGTILGAATGAFILTFLEAGILSIGLSEYYARFFFGLIIIIALISHKFSRMKRKGSK